ncbi:MAG: helicase-exonuclease AddAB subunit AddB [Blautia sp.]
MALHFIFGASGAGKSYYIYNKIIQESMEYPQKQFLVLVPEQFTMQTQKELVMMHPRKGIMNIDVLSFERLAFRVLEETGETCQQVLEDTGKSLVLRKVAQNRKKDLKIFGEKMQKQGYVSQMKSMLSELRQYEVTNEDMQRLISCAGNKPELYYKLKDIAVLYEGFFEYLNGKAITKEEVLDVLGEVAGKSGKLKNSVLVLDGYTGFTPVQMQVLRKILPLCQQMYVTVTTDKEGKPYQTGNPSDLFRLSQETVEKLCRIGRETGCPIEDTWITGTGRFADQPALKFLEKNIFRVKKQVYKEAQEAVFIRESRTPGEEIEEIALTIHRLIREKRLRWRNFAVITGDMETYADYAERIFGNYGIPCFTDRKKSLFMNPFVEFIRASMDMLVENYSYESVFRFLRCGLVDISEEEMDRLENYVIGMGIRSYRKWQEEWILPYRGQKPEEVPEIEKIRKKLMCLLGDFTERMKVRKEQVIIRLHALYDFIVSCKIQEKLKASEIYFEKQGMADKGKEYEQIYPVVMELFDKMAEILGDEKVSLREFCELLEAGLAEAKVGIIPPSEDQVLVGDMERTRLRDIQVLFFAGVNEGKIPKEEKGGKILTDLNREDLKNSQVALAPTARENLYMQKFYLYLTLTRPSRQLYLSYSRQNAQGEPAIPSFLIGEIKKLFPCIQTEKLWKEKERKLEMPESAMDYLAEGFQEILEKEPSDEWKEVFSWFREQKKWKDKLMILLKGAFPGNAEDAIGKSVARALYGTTLENSATRLELFAKCACAHFLAYGLELKERAACEFNAMDMGNVLHGGLEQFAKQIRQENLEWTELSKEQMEEIADRCVEQVVARYGNTVLNSDARNAYMVNRVKRIMQRTVWALAKQIELGKFHPSRFEVSFAMADSLESVNIALSEEEQMKLKGRIDRVDICEDEEHVYVKVIDYKSGNTSFDLVALYYGLQLQLVLYLNAAMELEQKNHPDKEIVPAGIFYYNIKDPVVDYVEEEGEEGLYNRILKQLRMNGIASADKAVLELMDKNLEKSGASSLSIPVSIKKDGNLAKTSSAVSEQQFRLISGYVNHKIREIGRRILDGETKAEPYEMGQKNGCQYCPYKGACGFDEKKGNSRYRRLASMKPQEIWDKMRQQMGSDPENGDRNVDKEV